MKNFDLENAEVMWNMGYDLTPEAFMFILNEARNAAKYRKALANLLNDSRLAGLSSIGNPAVFEARLVIQNTQGGDQS